MRLDHLLSREPIFLGDKQRVGRLVGVLVVFLCLHVFTAREWVVGVGACFGLGIKSFLQMSTLSGSRSTPCERPLPVWVVVARAAGLKGFFFGCGLCVVGCL